MTFEFVISYLIHCGIKQAEIKRREHLRERARRLIAEVKQGLTPALDPAGEPQTAVPLFNSTFPSIRPNQPPRSNINENRRGSSSCEYNIFSLSHIIIIMIIIWNTRLPFHFHQQAVWL